MASSIDEHQLSALIEYGACDVADVLSKLKDEYPHGGYIPDLDIYSPYDKASVKVVGRAFTVQMTHASDMQSGKPEKHFVDAASEGDVMMISAPPHLKNAVWGGLMTTGAQAKGVKGVIVDGRVRDLAEHRAAGFPVFARGHSVLGQGGYTRVCALGEPIHIAAHPPTVDHAAPAFAGMTVRTGDIVLADEDGVVVFKPEHLEHVLTACQKNTAIDAKIQVDLKKGRSVKESMAEHRGR